MTDRPIIFSGPMVQALLDGRKTQTRRILKPQPWNPERESAPDFEGWQSHAVFQNQAARGMKRHIHGVGTRLWVREQCATWEGGHRDVVYRADTSQKDWSDLSSDARSGAPWKRRPSIHMPRWASRLTLTVTDVRVQRLQDISEADAVAEGIIDGGCTECGGSSLVSEGCCYKPSPDFVDSFAALWNSLHGDDAWHENPWVAAYTFTVQRGNIDEVDA